MKKIIKSFKLFGSSGCIIELNKLIDTKEEEKQFRKELKEKYKNIKKPELDPLIKKNLEEFNKE